MTTPADVLRVAAAQIGTAENPPGSNETPYSRWYGVIGPWCAMFVSWCFSEAGLPQTATNDKGFAYCPTGLAWYLAHGAGSSGAAGVQPGDVVFWSFKGNGADHVDILEQVEQDGRLTTIGGNVGDKVQRTTRTPAQCVGYGRPAYNGQAAHLTDVSIGGSLPGIGGGQLDVPNPADVLGGLVDQVGQLAKAAQAVAGFAAFITNPANLLRLFQILLGAGLVVTGGVIVKRDAIVGTARQAIRTGKRVGEVAALAA